MCDTACDAAAPFCSGHVAGKVALSAPLQLHAASGARSAPLPCGSAKERTSCLEKESFGGYPGPGASVAWNAVVKLMCRVLVSFI